jgi:hypothetical protein
MISEVAGHARRLEGIVQMDGIYIIVFPRLLARRG